jgi:hypothetical protein
MLGRHNFEGRTCTRCGLVLKAPVRGKIIVEDLSPRERRGPVAGMDEFEAARHGALQSMGDALERARKNRS